MAVAMRELDIGSEADAYLHVQTKRAGKIKGEVVSEGHTDDIAVVGWNWGLTAASAVGSTQATGRRSYTALTIHKRVDAATTALMSALATNDEVKEAKLTLRRAGGQQDDYFIIKLAGARITSVQHVGDETGGTHETVAIAFNKVEVEYKPQKSTGLRSGSSMFMDEILPA
ncbi:MAG: type VI secretion system tube protein Hcp [Vitreoscilla sp.]|nr:type VI secretion system tube protein Hcp [Burkholderiales bacterium]MBP6338853.1 type VI secretion system tube protein Hcp [Vitreoscilla sp.]MBP6674900.1 type VI secretion system tube protein Hcp [Vitreoscilla sp.]